MRENVTSHMQLRSLTNLGKCSLDVEVLQRATEKLKADCILPVPVHCFVPINSIVWRGPT